MSDLIEKLRRGCEWQPVGDGSRATEPNTDATNETMMAAALALEELATVEGALERTLKREAALRSAHDDMLAALKLVQRTTFQMHEEAVRAVDAAIVKAEAALS